MESITEEERQKHKIKKQIFDDTDYKIMGQIQQNQKELNTLIIDQKLKQTEDFLEDNTSLAKKIELIESNQINQYWKNKYKKKDKLHAQRTKNMEKYVKRQAKKHQRWLDKEYIDYNAKFKEHVDVINGNSSLYE